MIAISLEIKNLDALRANFAAAPAFSLKYLAAATKAAIFEVEKQAVDSNFKFKTPRAFRTGYLAQSFSFGRSFANGGLRGSIGPTAHYAPYVYSGTARMHANPYMDRIAEAAGPAVNTHFEDAVDAIVDNLAKV